MTYAAGRSDMLHPDFAPRPYWWDDTPPTDAHAGGLPAQTEVLIVGAGYAGLNAALELARSGREVCVVEAELFGYGASTRNGGAVSAGTNLGKGISGTPGQRTPTGAAKDALEAVLRECAGAMDHIEGVIAREGIDCDYQRSGRFVGAMTPAHYDGLAAKIEPLNRLTKAGASLLPRDRQREHFGSDFYYGGMLAERSGKLHPSRYHRGLLDACARAGVRLCCNTRVTEITGRKGAFAVRTSAGTSRAAHAVIATNGYTDALAPQLRRRIVPTASHIIATEELPEGLGRTLIPTGRTISDTPRVLHYYRLSPDGMRVVFGGRARFTQVDPRLTAAILHARMVERFPELRGTRVTHSWSGLIAFTQDFMPHLGEDDGIHYCMGCNGSGVAMLSYLGYVVGRRIATDGAFETAFAARPFPPVAIPLYNGKPWFLPALGSYYRFLDRRDRSRATRQGAKPSK